MSEMTATVSSLPEAPGSFEHHGVKGMKWGVRKPRSAGPGPASAQKSASGVTTTSKKLPDGRTEWQVKDHASGKVARAVTTRGDEKAKSLVEKHAKARIDEAVSKLPDKGAKPTKKLSDQELRDAIARIELEKKYAELTRVPTKTKASDKIKKAVADGSNEAVKNVTKSVAQVLLMAAADMAVQKASDGKIKLKPVADEKKKDDKKKD